MKTKTFQLKLYFNLCIIFALSFGIVKILIIHEPLIPRSWGIICSPSSLSVGEIIRGELASHGFIVQIHVDAQSEFPLDIYLLLDPQLNEFSLFPPKNKCMIYLTKTISFSKHLEFVTKTSILMVSDIDLFKTYQEIHAIRKSLYFVPVMFDEQAKPQTDTKKIESNSLYHQININGLRLSFYFESEPSTNTFREIYENISITALLNTNNISILSRNGHFVFYVLSEAVDRLNYSVIQVLAIYCSNHHLCFKFSLAPSSDCPI
jgi:hypothetical protein